VFGGVDFAVLEIADVSLGSWWTVEGPLTKQTLLKVVLDSLVLMSLKLCSF
jgi:hypothetical protein